MIELNMLSRFFFLLLLGIVVIERVRCTPRPQPISPSTGPCSIGAPGLEGIPPALAVPGMPIIPGIPLLNKNLKCTENGYFELVQCYDGFCVCVDPSTGAEATATKTASQKIYPKCGRCHTQLAKYYRDSSKFFFRPMCNEKNGNYQPKQCQDEQHCFCVNVMNGVRLTKKAVPAIENLHCEGSQFDFSIDDSHLTKTEKGDDGKMHEQLVPIGSPICKMAKDAGARCATGPKTLKWYFDTNTFECLAFSYTGCGGNDNRFDTPAECWEKCKLAELNRIRITNQIGIRNSKAKAHRAGSELADLAGCAGMRMPARNKQGHTVICAGGPEQSTPGTCPAGFKCTMLAYMGVCCHTATQDLYESNYRPVCESGNQAVQMQTQGVPMTLIGKNCTDNFCPVGTKCVEKEIFAHCC